MKDIFLAAKEAGRQLAKDCRIPEEAQRAMSKELMSQDALLQGSPRDDGAVREGDWEIGELNRKT